MMDWGLIIILVLVGLVVIGTITNNKQKVAEVADQKQRMAQACLYVNEVNERRHFPIVPVGMDLQSGEFGLLQTSGQLSEMRSHGYSVGSSVRITKGLWVSGRQYHSYRAREIVDQGTIVITTRRIVYTGAKTVQIWLRDLIAIEGDVDCNIIHTARRQNAIFIHYREAALGLILIRIFASGILADNRVPTGVQVTARAEGESIAIKVDDAAAPVANQGLASVVVPDGTTSQSGTKLGAGLDNRPVLLTLPTGALIVTNKMIHTVRIPSAKAPFDAFFSVERYWYRPDAEGAGASKALAFGTNNDGLPFIITPGNAAAVKTLPREVIDAGIDAAAEYLAGKPDSAKADN
jgi:hypothetical protein